MQCRLSSGDILTIASSCCGAQCPSISLDITTLSFQFILMFDINSNDGWNDKACLWFPLTHLIYSCLFTAISISSFSCIPTYAGTHPTLLQTVTLLNTTKISPWRSQLAPLFPLASAAECDHFTVFPGLTSSNHRSAFRDDSLLWWRLRHIGAPIFDQ